MINNKGTYLLDPIYEDIDYFSDGRARVKYDNRIGYINAQFKFIIPFKYENGGNFYNKLTAVCYKNKWGIIDTNNNIVVPLIYDNIYYSSKDGKTYGVEKDGLYTMIYL